MQGILEFKLPQERREFNVASRADDWAATVADTLEFIRQKIKYGPEFSTPAGALEAVRTEIHAKMADLGISLADTR